MDKYVHNPPENVSEIIEAFRLAYCANEDWMDSPDLTEETGAQQQEWFNNRWNPLFLTFLGMYPRAILNSEQYMRTRPPRRYEDEDDDDDEKLPSPILSPSSEEDEYLEYLEHRNTGDEPAYIPKPEPHLFF